MARQARRGQAGRLIAAYCGGGAAGSWVGAVAYMALAHFLSQIYPTAWQLGLGLLLVAIALFARGGILGIVDQIAARFRRDRTPGAAP